MVVRRAAPVQHGRFRRAFSRAAEDKHIFVAAAAAGALGYAEREGWSIPHFGAAGEAGTLALAGYVLTRYGGVKSRVLRHATTGFACIAAYQLGKGEIGPKKKADGDINGGYRMR